MAGAKSLPVSPLAPPDFPELPVVDGVELGAVEAGIRYKGRTDLMMMRFATGTTVAGVLTTSKCASAPVDWCRANVGKGLARALVVNSGNANAFTGKAGAAAAKASAVAAAKLVGCKTDAVFLASTGVIGEVLPSEKVTAALPKLATTCKPDRWADAARAIMTTDTFPKAAFRRTEIDGKPVTIVGIAKGSGMIAPDMATMLAFVATDAAIPAEVLQVLLAKGADRSFNAITVDGDTSTSDTLLAFATGRAGHKPVTRANDPYLKSFKAAFEDLLIELAQLVVRDGEGATKFVTVTVTGAQNQKAARRIALSIANSPLVKTAVAGGDANWGRIVMAVGKAGERADRDALSIKMGGLPVAEKGGVHPRYDEAAATEHFKGRDIEIEVDVGAGGKGAATVWTCDLTHGYIDINADYRS